MKTFVIAFLAVMPMALCQQLPTLDYVYFEARGSDDNCTNPPQELKTVGTGQELTLFNCDGKEAGNERCVCIAGKINEQQLYFEKMCATCVLAAKPNKGYNEVFQLAAYHDLMLNLIQKLLLHQKLTDDDLYYYGADNSIKIPITSPKKMSEFTSNFVQLVKTSPQLTENQKAQFVTLIKTAFERYSGVAVKQPSLNLQQILGPLKTYLPKKLLKKLGINHKGVKNSGLLNVDLNELAQLIPSLMNGQKGSKNSGLLNVDPNQLAQLIQNFLNGQKGSNNSGLLNVDLNELAQLIPSLMNGQKGSNNSGLLNVDPNQLAQLIQNFLNGQKGSNNSGLLNVDPNQLAQLIQNFLNGQKGSFADKIKTAFEKFCTIAVQQNVDDDEGNHAMGVNEEDVDAEDNQDGAPAPNVGNWLTNMFAGYLPFF